MNPSEILKQEFKAINKKTHKVVFPCIDYCSTGFGLAPPSEKEPIEAPCKSYEHISFSTRAYRHESSATYKLIKFLEDSLKDTSEIYWRFEPEVIAKKDFGLQYEVFVGRVRFSSSVTGGLLI